MITLLCTIAYIAVIIVLLKIMFWVTKMWLKLSIGIIEMALVITALGLIF